jgi:predicted SAM-dependent methyltransferase
MANCKAKPYYNILDIGCGKGEVVCSLFNLGFHNVQGVDKFLHEPINYDFNVKILKKDITELPDQHYDILMMHHVFEHIEEQLAVLQECYRILKKNRFLLIRIPLKNFAWEKYKTNWVQIDAPRHYFIHTVESFRHLVSKTKFTIKKIEYDSWSFQFSGSEQYVRDIPLISDEKTSIFSEVEILEFEKQAGILNDNQAGDQAAFYLYKS